jgi:hypothetical protein
MNRRELLRGLLGVASVMLLAACDGSVTGKSFEPIRYKLTAIVETRQGLTTVPAYEIDLSRPAVGCR